MKNFVKFNNVKCNQIIFYIIIINSGTYGYMDIMHIWNIKAFALRFLLKFVNSRSWPINQLKFWILSCTFKF